MFRCFNLIDIPFLENNYEKGNDKYSQIKKSVEIVLEHYINGNGSLDGSQLQDNWLPEIECDIFISHSHKDEKKAIALSNYLNNLGLTCFVDSCIWSNVDNLLKLIDDKYCLDSQTNTYDYQKRNATTSHVHMMLNNALLRMMDNCECVFFLNSPNSIEVNDIITKTVSPWLYNEICTTQIIRKKIPKRELHKSINFSKQRNINESISISYDVNLSNFTKLDVNDFLKWISLKNPNQHFLDTLYQLLPLESERTSFIK